MESYPLIAYDSRTGNVKSFVKKLGLRNINVKETEKVFEDFVMITYTTGFGKVPESTLEFIERNKKYIIGVSSSGNRNWGVNFARAADIISSLYNVPIISKFELSGTQKDIEIFKEGAISVYERKYHQLRA